MEGTTLVILAIVALVGMIALFIGFGIWRGPRALYVRRESLFSADEASMLRRLEKALADDYLVIPKLAVIEMVDLRPLLSSFSTSERIVRWSAMEACAMIALLLSSTCSRVVGSSPPISSSASTSCSGSIADSR